MNRYDLAGRSLIATGVAGGIGRAIARVALADDARVTVRCVEIARMVAFLCSDDCSFSTGAVFDLSGGRATY